MCLKFPSDLSKLRRKIQHSASQLLPFAITGDLESGKHNGKFNGHFLTTPSHFILSPAWGVQVSPLAPISLLLPSWFAFLSCFLAAR